MTSAGLHHVTAICGQARDNVSYYTRKLGQHLIKRTVNFDDPGTWHLYYGNAQGSPGSIITFFPWENAQRGRRGSGEAIETAYIANAAAVAALEDAKDVQNLQFGERFGVKVARFDDPDGMSLAMVLEDEADSREGFHSVTLDVEDIGPTAEVLTEVFGWRETAREGAGQQLRVRYSAGGSNAVGQHVDLVSRQQGRAHFGKGSVHHIAFRAGNDAEQAEMARRLAAMRIGATEQKDRNYFRSIYFREPGGVLFEIATDAPGFAIDEPADRLGTKLMLPAQYEPMREAIIARLAPLE
ncbi:MAG: ring-cleaving dioxygenase [Hyphomicrobiales bacterium]|nr:ring-cleaving dioxygenase [Hyphomicrobiales bacterium]MDE2113988.1 ring-cleaving dioxygenase [Hyphomicrobiales bacterium]